MMIDGHKIFWVLGGSMHNISKLDVDLGDSRELVPKIHRKQLRLLLLDRITA